MQPGGDHEAMLKFSQNDSPQEQADVGSVLGRVTHEFQSDRPKGGHGDKGEHLVRRMEDRMQLDVVGADGGVINGIIGHTIGSRKSGSTQQSERESKSNSRGSHRQGDVGIAVHPIQT